MVKIRNEKGHFVKGHPQIGGFYKGHKHSKKTKIKIGLTSKGRKFSKEHRQKIGKANKGKKRPGISGKNHPNWVGGRKKDTNGYMLVKIPNHPFSYVGNYAYEHRLEPLIKHRLSFSFL